MPRAQRFSQSIAAAAPVPLFVSLELNPSRWLLAPGGETMSKYSVAGGDGSALLNMLAHQCARAERQAGRSVQIVTIQEAGLDGFWIYRLLEANGVESQVVEPALVTVSRRHRRAKTDAINGEALLRTLMAHKRGEPRVYSMVVPPSPEEEDRRQLSRERQTLFGERIEHTNRIKGLLAAQGVTGYEPLRPDCRERLEVLRTGDGRPLPPRLKAEIGRALGRKRSP